MELAAARSHPGSHRGVVDVRDVPSKGGFLRCAAPSPCACFLEASGAAPIERELAKRACGFDSPLRLGIRSSTADGRRRADSSQSELESRLRITGRSRPGLGATDLRSKRAILAV